MTQHTLFTVEPTEAQPRYERHGTCRSCRFRDPQGVRVVHADLTTTIEHYCLATMAEQLDLLELDARHISHGYCSQRNAWCTQYERVRHGHSPR